MIEKKQLFTGITEEESATVCGGATTVSVYTSGGRADFSTQGTNLVLYLGDPNFVLYQATQILGDLEQLKSR